MTDAIDTGDAVLHKPTGQHWCVAFVDGESVCCMGWPLSYAKLSDCELVEKATKKYKSDHLNAMVEMHHKSDPRYLYAKWKLSL